ncbi:MAG: hypothetical protein K2G64_02735 [Muribaculaceae bacterium]|nr:hypothetical protein [Muribaculaceae bacterium]MDE5967999.1 hypothetical protein [Muribaculaceae bacterium]MDE7393137.1 hypothetical protein [Muribaculaceae bacterium]
MFEDGLLAFLPELDDFRERFFFFGVGGKLSGPLTVASDSAPTISAAAGSTPTAFVAETDFRSGL